MKDNKIKLDPTKCDALVEEVKLTGGMTEEVKVGLVQAITTLAVAIRAIDSTTCDEAVIIKACQTIGSIAE